MRKLLIWLCIIQKVDNRKRKEKGKTILGHKSMYAYRLNPYNPLSYAVLIITPVIAVVMFGIVGVWKEVDLTNPFKWI